MKFLDAKGQQETFDTEQKHFNIAFNADCMNFMKNIPDNYFSLCIVDPPYGDAGNGDRGGETSADGSSGIKWNRFGQWFDRYKRPF